jgi:hypothetical protein
MELTPTAADRAIMADTDLGFRVLDLSTDPFKSARASYFHRSVGGYHGAKLARYQDLIDRYLTKADGDVLDMLNTRYLIVRGEDGRPEPRLRTTAYGPAWFVGEVSYAPTAMSEIEQLGQVNLHTTAVVAGKDSALISTPVSEVGENQITMTDYRPHYQRYSYTATTDAVAVFSEIYYDKGWTAYIDGEEAPYFRADYVLRAMQLPAGEHVVEWRFRAPRWGLVSGITLVASLAVLIAALVAAILSLKRK